MTDQECTQLDDLLAIAHEEDTPLNTRTVEFLESLDGRREFQLSPAQGDWFDNLVRTHLTDD